MKTSGEKLTMTSKVHFSRKTSSDRAVISDANEARWRPTPCYKAVRTNLKRIWIIRLKRLVSTAYISLLMSIFGWIQQIRGRVLSTNSTTKPNESAIALLCAFDWRLLHNNDWGSWALKPHQTRWTKHEFSQKVCLYTYYSTKAVSEDVSSNNVQVAHCVKSQDQMQDIELHFSDNSPLLLSNLKLSKVKLTSWA